MAGTMDPRSPAPLLPGSPSSLPRPARPKPPGRKPFPHNVGKLAKQRIGIPIAKPALEQLFFIARHPPAKLKLHTTIATRIRDQFLLVLSYEFALRASEPGRILMTDLTLTGPGSPSLRVPRVKGGQILPYPIPAYLMPLLQDYLAIRRLPPGAPHPVPPEQDFLFPSRQLQRVNGEHRVVGISRYLVMKTTVRYLDALGLHQRLGLTHHALRHALGTHMLEAGFTHFEIKDALGHNNIASTEKYATMTPKGRVAVRRRMATSKIFARPEGAGWTPQALENKAIGDDVSGEGA